MQAFSDEEQEEEEANQEAKQAKQTHEAVDEEEPIERLLDVRFPLTQASMHSHVCLDEGVHRGAASAGEQVRQQRATIDWKHSYSLSLPLFQEDMCTHAQSH